MILLWHKFLRLPKWDKEWFEKKLSEELIELQESKMIVARWSELADVEYTYTRATLDAEHTMGKCPLSFKE